MADSVPGKIQNTGFVAFFIIGVWVCGVVPFRQTGRGSGDAGIFFDNALLCMNGHAQIP